MSVKLVGTDDGAVDGYVGTNYVLFLRYQAVSSGSMTLFYFKSGGTGDVKVALYTDSNSEPGSLIAAMNTGQAVGTGWVSVSFTSTSITSGTYYWLGICCDSDIVGYTGPGTATRRYKAVTYSTYTFPNPAGSGYTADTYGHRVAGWGNVPQTIIPSSISQSIGYGSPKLVLSIKPSSVLQGLAYGSPIVLTSIHIILPSSIIQVVAIGTPSLRHPQAISPLSTVQTVAVGTPWVGIFGFIKPQSTVQQISTGSPTILKYVWHVIWDGRYATETPGVNRTYVVGRDQYGNPVYGTAVNTDEVALVGERLDFQPDLAIPITAQAAEVASAVLSKMRLAGKRGVILIPPNCGQELFDAVQISDSGANQSAVKLRVVGIRFEYNPRQAKYEHKLILGAP